MNKTLKSFVEYCEANPELRFWQALRSWGGYNFIFVSKNKRLLEELDWENLIDTFYIND